MLQQAATVASGTAPARLAAQCRVLAAASCVAAAALLFHHTRVRSLDPRPESGAPALAAGDRA